MQAALRARQQQKQLATERLLRVRQTGGGGLVLMQQSVGAVQLGSRLL